MHTMNRKMNRFLALFLSLSLSVFSPVGDITLAYAGTTSSTPAPPQVLIALTNSQSMDGTTSGAIMTGSGTVSGLSGSSSPTDYQIPTGFNPPLYTNSNGTTAPYTVIYQNGAYVPAYTSGASGTQYDNSPSRLALAKDAISSAIRQYGSVINFALEDYQVSSPSVYTTWVYYMSPSSSRFTFTNTATPEVVGSGNPYTVANPCYQYTTNTNTQVVNACTALDSYYYSGATNSTANYQYMLIGASSDDPSINDVLYWSSGPAQDPIFLDYGGPSPSTPYPPNYSLSDYENGNVGIGYPNVTPSGITSTGPTNAGYVPYSPEVMYAQRGFGYYGYQSATTGNTVVPFASSGTNAISAFSSSLAPETNSQGTREIKADAVQSPIYGLLTGALNAFGTSSSTNCNKYVILVTDGLPTQDKNGNNWPPLGSASAAAYGVTAGFNSDGSLNTSASATNDQALLDTISAIKNLYKAGIKTYVIGLGAGIDPTDNPVAAQALTAMAIAGHTQNYYAANNPGQVTTALQSIVQQIYSSSAISSPVLPPSATGSSYDYVLTSDASPIAGHADAYSAYIPPGQLPTPVWDAGSLMTTSNRQQLLLSDTGWPSGTATTSGNGSGSMMLFNNLSSLTYASAFNLTATSCVPNTSTIVSYTLNPNYSYTPSGSSTACSYLAGRSSQTLLGGLSLQDSAMYLGPPSNANYLGNTSYTTWAQSQQNRTPMLLFTSNDGFLYAVNAQTGALLWGWMPSAFLSQLQNFSGFENQVLFNGGFTTVDAQDSQGNWATYVVGSAQNGAAYYALKLGSTSQGTSATPTAVAWWNSISGGTAPGEQNINHPAAQAPAIAIINGSPYASVYAVYIVNTTKNNGTTTSTLYEQNVATGAVTSGALSITASGQVYYDSTSETLFVGDTSGNLWQVFISGSASLDKGSTTQVGTTYGASAINYVGYTEIDGVPYAWAADGSSVTVFTTGSNGWQPLWASTNTAGYAWTIPQGGTGSWTTSTTVTALTANSEVSDAPTFVNGVLTVPTYSPPVSGTCPATGTGYGDLFSLVDGTFPVGQLTDSQGSPITQDLTLGAGLAFSATVATNSSGVPTQTSVWWSTQGTTVPPSPLSVSGAVTNQPIAWRQH